MVESPETRDESQSQPGQPSTFDARPSTLLAFIAQLERELAADPAAMRKLTIEQHVNALDQYVRAQEDIPVAAFAALSPLHRRTALCALCAAWREQLR